MYIKKAYTIYEVIHVRFVSAMFRHFSQEEHLFSSQGHHPCGAFRLLSLQIPQRMDVAISLAAPSKNWLIF